MQYKKDWEETKRRFKAWWDGSNSGRPLMWIVAKRRVLLEELECEEEFTDAEDFHLNLTKRITRYRNYLKSHIFMADSFPNFDFNLGAGSMAIYLGVEPNFHWDTIWFKECVQEGFNSWGRLYFDQENLWWRKHFELIRSAKELSQDDFLVNIPDIVENIDILAAMRGSQELCYDLVDEPNLVKDYIEQVDELYFLYYDRIYEMVKGRDGSSSYTAFNIWGPGKTAKVQCDFCALMSPFQFREFIQPSLEKQCALLDYSMYHLDGPDAVKHLDALMEIKKLNALQWTPGAGNPDGGYEGWYPIYDKVKAAGKSLWIKLEDGDIKDWVEASERLVKRYGTEGLYLLYPQMEEHEALDLIAKAERDWA